MSVWALTTDSGDNSIAELDGNLHTTGSLIIEGGLFANSTAAPDANSCVRRDWVQAWTPHVLLINSVGDLPGGTPAGVIVVVKA